jgi:filamentous hemagglutinin family protein
MAKSVIAMILAFAIVGTIWSQDGEQVKLGNARIDRPDAQTVLINQFTDKAVLHWNSFSIDAGHLVRFNQPSSSSVALNRVVGQDPSVILGSLQANGRLFLINPNGILFGSSAQVNVGGLVASTLNLSDESFWNGDLRLAQDPSKSLSYAINQGTITAAEGGYVILAAPFVENTGTINAPAGTIHLAAGREVTLDLGGGMIQLSLGTANEKGEVHLRPDIVSNVAKAVVNAEGMVEAGRIVEENGEVKLVGAEGTAINSGRLSANGRENVRGGTIQVDSTQATVTTRSSVVEADGFEFNSSGGCIRIVSQKNVNFEGRLLARGGRTGDGGEIEVSAPTNLYFWGYADATAAAGAGGLVYIDPDELTYQDAAGSQDGGLGDNQIVAADPNIPPNTVSVGVLEGLPAAQNLLFEAVNRQTFANLGGDQTINFATTAPNTVTFRTTTNGDNNGIRFTDFNDGITTAGGNIVFQATGALAPNFGLDLGNLNSNGGRITLFVNANMRANNITAAGNTIQIHGDVNVNGVGGVSQQPGAVWTANDLIVEAADGIEIAGAPILTNVRRAQFRNDFGAGVDPAVTGSIRIQNQGALQLIDLLGGGGLSAVLNDSVTAGAVTNIETSGNLTLSGTVGSNVRPGNPAGATGVSITLTTTAGGNIIDDGVQSTTLFSPVSINLNSAGAIGQLQAPPENSAFFDLWVDVACFNDIPLTVNATANGNILISRTAQGPAGLTEALQNTSTVTYNSIGANTVGLANLVGVLNVNSGLFQGIDDNVILGSREFANNNANLLGNVQFSGAFGVNTTGQTLRVHADRSIVQAAGAVTNLQTAANGRIELNSDSPLTAAVNPGGFGLINLSLAGLTITTGNLVARSSQGVTITGTLTINQLQATNGQGGPVQPATNVLITTAAGGWTVADIDNVGYGVRNLGTGNITLTTVADQIFNADVFAASGNINLTSTTGNLVDDAVQTTETTTNGGVITLLATLGNIGAQPLNNYFDIGPGYATFSATAGQDIFVSQIGGTLNTSQVTVFNSAGPNSGLANIGGSLNVNSNLFGASTDNLFLDTTVGNLTIGSAVSTNNGTIQITAAQGGNVQLNAGVSTTGAAFDLNITANGGGSILDDGDQTTFLSATGNINLNADIGSIGQRPLALHIDVDTTSVLINAQAGQDVFLSFIGVGNTTSAALVAELGVFNSTAAGGAGTVGLANMSGNLDHDDNIFNGIDDNVALGASGTLTITNPINSTGTGLSSFVCLTGDLTVNNTVTSTGSVEFNAAANLVVNQAINAGVNVSFTAGTDILQNANLTGGAAGAGTYTAGGRIVQGAPNSFITGGPITFRAAGDILLGLNDAGGAADMRTTGGSIIDNNDVVPDTLNVRARGDSVMTAGGTIGVPNCIEVDIINGSLTVQASGQAGMAPFAQPVSVNICGSVAPSQTLIYFTSPFPLPGFLGVTPGLVIFNGQIVNPQALAVPQFPTVYETDNSVGENLVDLSDRYDNRNITIVPPYLIKDSNLTAPINAPRSTPADTATRNPRTGVTTLEAMKTKTYLGGALAVEDARLENRGGAWVAVVRLRNTTFRQIKASYLIEFRAGNDNLVRGQKPGFQPFSVDSQETVEITNSIGSAVKSFDLYIVGSNTGGQGQPDPRK